MRWFIFCFPIILSSDAMNVGIAECEAKMGKSMDRKGKVVTHTAEGDIHDIGQVIVNALLNANGFEVINLGADVPVDKVVSAVKKEHGGQVYGHRDGPDDHHHDGVPQNRSISSSWPASLFPSSAVVVR